jgi:hypothetical protein
LHDDRRCHGASTNGGDDAQDFRPVGADQLHVDPSGDERFEGRVIGRFAEASEGPVNEGTRIWRLSGEGPPSRSGYVPLCVPRPSRRWGVWLPLMRSAHAADRRESVIRKVTVTYRLCSPPRFWTLSCVPEGQLVSSGRYGMHKKRRGAGFVGTRTLSAFTAEWVIRARTLPAPFRPAQTGSPGRKSPSPTLPGQPLGVRARLSPSPGGDRPEPWRRPLRRLP